jgi:hypothetical protein
VTTQPVAFGEGMHEGLVQAPGLGSRVFDTGTLSQFGLFEARLLAPGVLFGSWRRRWGSVR